MWSNRLCWVYPPPKHTHTFRVKNPLCHPYNCGEKTTSMPCWSGTSCSGSVFMRVKLHLAVRHHGQYYKTWVACLVSSDHTSLSLCISSGFHLESRTRDSTKLNHAKNVGTVFRYIHSKNTPHLTRKNNYVYFDMNVSLDKRLLVFATRIFHHSLLT